MCFQCAFQLLSKLLVLAAVTMFGLRTFFALLLKVYIYGVRCTTNSLIGVSHKIRGSIKETIRKLIRKTAD